MFTFEFRKTDADTASQLIALSQIWVDENCSHGMVKNTLNDLHEPLAVALYDSKIIGYIFGHFYQQERGTSYIEIGKNCFSVDELYVLPQFRKQGVGSTLYRMMEGYVKDNCDYITLATSTKDYRSILKLYIEELNMDFHSAFLIKRTDSFRED